eukprot:scaffold58029_cov63-Phaeocystis_antarctica.AAC.3
MVFVAVNCWGTLFLGLPSFLRFPPVKQSPCPLFSPFGAPASLPEEAPLILVDAGEQQRRRWRRRSPRGTKPCGKRGDSGFGQLALQRLLQRQIMPQAAPSSASLSQPAAWAALAGHTGLVFHIGTRARTCPGSVRTRSTPCMRWRPCSRATTTRRPARSCPR